MRFQAADQGALADPATWYLPAPLQSFMYSSWQQAVLQGLSPLLMYLARACGSANNNHADPAHPTLRMQQHGKRRKQDADTAMTDALRDSSTGPLLGLYASLPAGWLEALSQLSSPGFGQADGKQSAHQLHEQLQRAWSAVGCLLESVDPHLQPVLEAYLRTLAATCKVGLHRMLCNLQGDL